MKSTLNIQWKDWYWSQSSSTLATWCEELTPWKRPWCWERLKAGGEATDRGWDGWMASLTWCTWVWASYGSWWWTGKPGVLQSIRLQRDTNERLNWTDILNHVNTLTEKKGLERSLKLFVFFFLIHYFILSQTFSNVQLLLLHLERNPLKTLNWRRAIYLFPNVERNYSLPKALFSMSWMLTGVFCFDTCRVCLKL